MDSFCVPKKTKKRAAASDVPTARRRARGPEDRAGAGGRPKVDQRPRVQPWRAQHVARLEVAVDEAQRVHALDALRGVNHRLRSIAAADGRDHFAPAWRARHDTVVPLRRWHQEPRRETAAMGARKLAMQAMQAIARSMRDLGC